jgi:hypothetical protein
MLALYPTEFPRSYCPQPNVIPGRTCTKSRPESSAPDENPPIERVPGSLCQAMTNGEEIDDLRSSVGIAISVCLSLLLWMSINTASVTLS